MPDWYGSRILALGDQRAARIGLSGPTAPGLLEDLDPVRAGSDRLPAVKESGKVVNDRTTNWTIMPVPDAGVGDARVPGPAARGGAGGARASSCCTCCGSTRPDPIAAWRARADTLVSAAADAHRARLRRPPLRGAGHRPHRRPAARRASGTPRASRPSTASSTCPTSRPRRCSPPPTRTVPTAIVTSSKPLVLIDGTVVRGLRVRFEGGRAVQIDADDGRRTPCARSSRGRGRRPARRGRAGRRRGPDRQARHRLLRHADRRERRQPHRARPGLPVPAPERPERPRERRAEIHIDFMIGSPEMTVTGITREATACRCSCGGSWQI